MPLDASDLHSWQLAQTALMRHDLLVARRHLQDTLATDPHHVAAHVLLGGVMLASNELRAACQQLLTARLHLPQDAAMILRVAQALMRVGETVATRECLQHPAVSQCRDGAILAALAHLHQSLGEHVQALALMDRARDCGFDNPDFRYYRSVQLQFNGRLLEAEHQLEACLGLGPTHGRASLTLARLRKQTRDNNHLDYIHRQISRVEPGSEDHAAFEFAKSKELDDLGELSSAWQALARANVIMHRRIQHDSAGEQKRYETLMSLCDAGFVTSTNPAQPGPIPIFVIGMPRSGTTVIDRLLGNHSCISSAGELGDFAHQLHWAADRPGRSLLDDALFPLLQDMDYDEVGRRYLAQTQWRAHGRSYFIDKLPANFMLAGLIAKSLPSALFLHLTRDPIDVCFSNFRAFFGSAYGYSYDLETLAAHYQLYRRMMAHWHAVLPGRVLDVEYELLVTQPKHCLRGVLNFIGLEYEEACSDLSRNTTPSSTLSSAQIREDIHSRSIAEWRRYETQLEPLRGRLSEFLAPC